MPDPNLQVTRLLAAIGEGDAHAADDLLPLVYEELRQLAGVRMAREPAGHTLQPTALVHEAFLRLVGGEEVQWANRAHFFAAAARAMRRILVERARHYRREKHGAGRARVELEHVQPAATGQEVDLLALDDALERLRQYDERKCEVVTLRYFGGLTIDQTATALDLSPATVKTDWQFAKAWLHRALADEHPPESDGADPSEP